MTQRRRTSKAKAKRRFGRRAFLTGAGVAACAAAGWCLRQKSDADHTAASGQDTPTAPNPALPAGEWRAVWVSYLDWALLDFSTEDTFRAGAAQLLDNCAGLGLNTVLAGAPLRGCTVPQQFVPVEPSVHRGAGQRPRL